MANEEAALSTLSHFDSHAQGGAMGKKYYGGIGTNRGFVMHSSESKYHYSRDDEFHKEGDKRDVGSTSNTGGGVGRLLRGPLIH